MTNLPAASPCGNAASDRLISVRRRLGDAFQARAGRASHRTLLRGFGHAATIAIALSGCARPLDSWKAKEVPASTYADIQNSLIGQSANSPERLMVKRFMSDGMIDYTELEQLNDYDAAERNRATDLTTLKAELAGDAQ